MVDSPFLQLSTGNKKWIDWIFCQIVSRIDQYKQSSVQFYLSIIKHGEDRLSEWIYHLLMKIFILIFYIILIYSVHIFNIFVDKIRNYYSGDIGQEMMLIYNCRNLIRFTPMSEKPISPHPICCYLRSS